MNRQLTKIVIRETESASKFVVTYLDEMYDEALDLIEDLQGFQELVTETLKKWPSFVMYLKSNEKNSQFWERSDVGDFIRLNDFPVEYIKMTHPE